MLNVIRHFGVAVPTEEALANMTIVQMAYFEFAQRLSSLLPDCDESNSALIGLESSMNFALSAIERGPYT